MTVQDTRLAETVFAGSVAVHQPVGSPGAPTNVDVRDAAAAVTAFQSGVADVRAGTAGPLQQARQIAAAAAPAVRALDAAAKTNNTHRESLSARMAVPVLQDPTGRHTIVSLAIAALRRAALPTERAQMDHAARTGEAPETLLCYVTLPAVLTGLTPQQRAGFETSVRRLADPAAFDAMKIEAEQIASATQALALMVRLVADAGIPRSEIDAAAPNLAVALTASPPRFAPERVEDA